MSEDPRICMTAQTEKWHRVTMWSNQVVTLQTAGKSIGAETASLCLHKIYLRMAAIAIWRGRLLPE